MHHDAPWRVSLRCFREFVGNLEILAGRSLGGMIRPVPPVGTTVNGSFWVADYETTGIDLAASALQIADPPTRARTRDRRMM